MACTGMPWHKLWQLRAPEDELSVELLLLLEVDESSDDEELEESPLLEESKSSEEDVGFLLLLFFSPGLTAALPFSASLGSSSEAPRKRGLYCMPAEFVQTGNMDHMPAASNALCSPPQGNNFTACRGLVCETGG